ncbi:2-polyprenyl-6-methoxyphenol hydroxylase-like FAD-dependent oxidoreductase [Nocardia tenerifensis]|uniref:2-polyprenyl-6-methoxyphenol hydroxylase-like FAD-dependent oxidoreductase n=1 Tax=Nocardia tenerifensis TaxID=228006 RepID=A0A318KCK6_9NOCA|nr:FAD-dependent oxidoreductase [Nocardia tenerifensis]PXX70665.1 2-polyprenyl-6-methoxyphenol hydroxylase-like FAD-dependent oxidoreductase [Nocardia tenerifensis]
MNSCDVLIIGAGPTGLSLACELARRGVTHLIVDRRDGPATEPRALVLWSGAHESLLALGVDPDDLAQGVELHGATYWSRGRRIGRIGFGSLADRTVPMPISLPQPAVEAALHARYRALGGKVRWHTAFERIEVADATRTTALLIDRGAAETVTTQWIVGADGAHSRVRGAAGIPFEGATYPESFVLVDGALTSAEESRTEAQYHLHPDGVTVVVPLPDGLHRVFLSFDPGPDAPAAGLTLESVNALLHARALDRFTVRQADWISDFRIHRRLASRYIEDRVVLVGDAAHIHSPVGGQGMNTGIQDAVNLGWKLAAHLEHGLGESLVHSYEVERRPVAQQVSKVSNVQTRLWTLRKPWHRAIRDGGITAVGVLRPVTGRIVASLAQIDLDYGHSPLTTSGTARTGLMPGRRLGHYPIWIDGRAGAVRQRLADPRPLVIAAGAAANELAVIASESDGRVQTLAIADRLDRFDADFTLPIGIDRDGALFRDLGSTGLALIRPDGYIAAVSTGTTTREPFHRLLAQLAGATRRHSDSANPAEAGTAS